MIHDVRHQIHAIQVLMAENEMEEANAYAKRHAVVLNSFSKRSCTEDLIYGGSGAILSLVHLYQITGDPGILASADDFAAHILEQAKTDGERLWLDTNRKGGLAGMAHGNSGVGLAFSYLAEANPARADFYRERQEGKRVGTE